MTLSTTADRETGRAPLTRTLFAGALGGLTFNVIGFLTFVLIGTGLDKDGPLLDPDRQSHKMIEVWTTLRPLPKFDTQPATILAIYLVVGIGYAVLYRSTASAWPVGYRQRTVRLALTIWTLSCMFFELLGPFNLLAEPLLLVALEGVFWAAMALAAAAVIVATLDRRSRSQT